MSRISKWRGRVIDGGGTRRVSAAGKWTIAIPTHFEQIDNQDSWQAYAGSRVIYVSALTVRESDGMLTPIESLRTTAVRTLAGSSGLRLTHSVDSLHGEAEVNREGAAWQLKGYMCAVGTIATCVVDYPMEEDFAWAVTTWRSLEYH